MSRGKILVNHFCSHILDSAVNGNQNKYKTFSAIKKTYFLTTHSL